MTPLAPITRQVTEAAIMRFHSARFQRAVSRVGSCDANVTIPYALAGREAPIACRTGALAKLASSLRLAGCRLTKHYFRSHLVDAFRRRGEGRRARLDVGVEVDRQLQCPAWPRKLATKPFEKSIATRR